MQAVGFHYKKKITLQKWIEPEIFRKVKIRYNFAKMKTGNFQSIKWTRENFPNTAWNHVYILMYNLQFHIFTFDDFEMLDFKRNIIVCTVCVQL